MAAAKLRGVVFSDLGEAKAFMLLDWVKQAIEERMGFLPYPGTLNLVVESDEDRALWREVKSSKGIELPPADPSFCPARLYPVAIEDIRSVGGTRLPAAVLLPGVEDYPENKIEVVAPVHVKECLGLSDGDALIVEFGAS